MNKILYVIIPVGAISLILLNMLYGHTLFESNSNEVANKYEIYVHLQPEWNKQQKNILFEITNYWNKEGSENTFEKNVSNHNFNELQYLGEKSYVELKHDFSDCQDEWQPILYRRAVDTFRNEIELLQGNQIDPDSKIPIYPNVENESYDESEQELKIREGFSQFIPICTSKETTSYDYSIKTDSSKVGFDVYFVSSIEEREDFHESSNDFEFYTKDGCFAKNKKSFSGFCDDVNKNSGLLIVIPDDLEKPLTKVVVTLKEREV